MSRALRVEVEALDELHEAAEWYEGKRPGLGVAFVEAIDRTLGRVLELPSSFPLIMKRPPVQRALVRKFPYAVVFITRPDAIHVIAYTHAKRRPLYWAHRIVAEE
jgi:toxin ParE1/3/4